MLIRPSIATDEMVQEAVIDLVPIKVLLKHIFSLFPRQTQSGSITEKVYFLMHLAQVCEFPMCQAKMLWKRGV